MATAFVGILQIERCKGVTSFAMKKSCGISTLASVAGSIALVVGEIASIANHKILLEDLEYNQSDLIEIREQCLDGDGADAILKEDFVEERCTQFSPIIAQRDAYTSMRKALDVQLWTRRAAGVIYLLARLLN